MFELEGFKPRFRRSEEKVDVHLKKGAESRLCVWEIMLMYFELEGFKHNFGVDWGSISEGCLRMLTEVWFYVPDLRIAGGLRL